jgi:hypothetical protein
MNELVSADADGLLSVDTRRFAKVAMSDDGTASQFSRPPRHKTKRPSRSDRTRGSRPLPATKSEVPAFPPSRSTQPIAGDGFGRRQPDL